ncbi:MAG: hypothetical protein DRJ05_00500 [Bacteroidetes bacterium]|nr:MAG: hypothetical protein DRJ05_00500 [Bacteroidota bacterium]
MMVLQDIIDDIHALGEDLGAYERKYGVLSETFYESYLDGEEPEDTAWILDWSDWAGVFKIWLRRHEQYKQTIGSLRANSKNLINVIERTARHESISVAS